MRTMAERSFSEQTYLVLVAPAYEPRHQLVTKRDRTEIRQGRLPRRYRLEQTWLAATIDPASTVSRTWPSAAEARA